MNIVSEVNSKHTGGYVLLADDDADDRFLFAKALQSIHAAIPLEYAVNGLEALEKLQQPPTPAIIFTDLNMPKLNGLEFLKRLKQIDRLKDVPVIAYSTSSSKEHIEAMFAAGADHYMIKHESFQLLCKDLELVLSRFMK